MEITQKKERTINHDLKIEDLLNVINETNVSSFFNTWGPICVNQIFDPLIDLKGIFVIDNTIIGPGFGEIKISPNITPRRVYHDARKMSLSCALANVKFGGAAVGVMADPSKIDKIKFMNSLAKRLSPYIPKRFVAAPGLGIGQEEMTTFVEEIGDRKGVTGKPERMEGTPYELGVIGFGMAIAVETCIKNQRISDEIPSDISDIRIAIQGFDNIGHIVGRYLAKKGGNIIAISYDWCAVSDYNGIDLDKMKQYTGAKSEKDSFKQCNCIKKQPRDDIIKVDCDILITTTANNLITENNLDSLRAKCVVEGINEPISQAADRILYEKDIFILPDILTTAGGPISSYSEYCGINSDMAFSSIEKIMKEITNDVIARSQELDIPLRRVAKEIAKERILQAMEVNE